MIQQERKYPLAEVHTNVGTMGEVRFDQGLLDVLGVKPGERIVFLVDTQGVVTVQGEKPGQTASPAKTARTLRPTEVTQAPLFADAPLPATLKRRARKR